MATIQEVAQLARVSPMTVSRVLNKSAPVKAETRERVELAIEKLDYVPNRLAQSVVSRNGARILALVMPDIVNPFCTGVARGVEDTAQNNDYALIICNHDDDPQKEEGYFRSLLSLKVDGFLLMPSGDRAKRHIALLADKECPFVLIDRKPRGYVGDYVAGDNVNGSAELVRLLVSRGHHRIGFISGPNQISTARERLTGYKLGLEQSGITFDPELVYPGESFESGIAADPGLAQFLGLASVPTAVLACNNTLAIGFLRAVRKRGMDIPADFALACFDKIEVMDLIKPTVTAAIQPAYNFGTIATQLLLEKLRGSPVEKNREIILRPEIVVGESTEVYKHPNIISGSRRKARATK
jgi:LacI family transcriptional regulator